MRNLKIGGANESMSEMLVKNYPFFGTLTSSLSLWEHQYLHGKNNSTGFFSTFLSGLFDMSKPPEAEFLKFSRYKTIGFRARKKMAASSVGTSSSS